MAPPIGVARGCPGLAVTAQQLVPGRSGVAEAGHTPGARWLRPSEWPASAWRIFRPRPVDTVSSPVVVSRYADVQQILLAPGGAWSREVPLAVVPAEARHCILDASWMRDGEPHRLLRGTLSGINRGSTDAARTFTRTLTRLLLGRLLSEPPPWNLSPVIDKVSLRLIIEHTLQAPPLLEYAGLLRRLSVHRGTGRRSAGDGSAQLYGYFGIQRQRELERILLLADERYADLPPGLARHLVDLRRTGVLTIGQLVSQLGLLVVSYESQAAMAASLLGMLLEHDLLGYAAHVVASDPELLRRLVAEGGRRGISFPMNLLTAAKSVSCGGVEIPAGTPVLVSYAAGNMDPERFGEDAARFDPRPARPGHLAFGAGGYRCPGEVSADQFMEDVLRAAVAALPADVRLGHGGQVLRETSGVAWTVPELPVEPG